MQSLLVQLIVIAAFAIAAWWLTERFSPDALLTKLVKLVIFVGVLVWVILRLVPHVF